MTKQQHQQEDVEEALEYGRPRASSTPKIPKRRLPVSTTSQPATKPATPRSDIDIELNDTTDDLQPKGVCTPRIQSSFVLCCGFLCFGSSMAIIGPTVLELGCLTGQDVGAMSWVFFAQTFSALLGAIISGVITDRFSINYNLFLSIILVLHGIALCILPFMRQLATLIIVTSLHGLFAGFQDTATNLRMIIMHGQDVPPYLQTLFFFYGVGAFLSPIIAGNFLNTECNSGQAEGLGEEYFMYKRHVISPVDNIPFWANKMATSLATSAANATADENLEPHIIRITTTRIHWAYFIIAMLHLVVTAGLIYLYFVEKRRREELNLSLGLDESHDSLDDTASKSERSEIDPNIRSQVLCISFWIAIMVFASDGLQGSFGSYIYTYAIKSGIGISTDDAAYLNSLFWGTLALGRLLAIFVSMYVSPKIMLLADVSGCLLSIILMFVFRYHLISLWIGTAAFGLCLSNIFPTSVSMAESYFRLTGTITCFFVVCSGMGEMAIPLLIGKLFDYIGPISFLAVSTILCFTSVGIYVAVVITGKGISTRLELMRTSTPDLLEDDNKPTLDEFPDPETAEEIREDEKKTIDSAKTNTEKEEKDEDMTKHEKKDQ